MDTWTVRQLKTMELGGNNNARTYFQKNGYNMSNMSQLKEKYASRQSQQYRAHLTKLVDAAMKEGEIKDAGAANLKTVENELSDSPTPDNVEKDETAAVTEGVGALKVAQKAAKAKLAEETRFNTLRFNGYSREEAKAKLEEEAAAAAKLKVKTPTLKSPETKKVTLNMGAMFATGGTTPGGSVVGATKPKTQSKFKSKPTKRMGAKRLS
jgi:ADP-ribosylation factor GTPase-activating protein 2/3